MGSARLSDTSAPPTTTPPAAPSSRPSNGNSNGGGAGSAGLTPNAQLRDPLRGLNVAAHFDGAGPRGRHASSGGGELAELDAQTALPEQHTLDLTPPDFLPFSQLPPSSYPLHGWFFLCTIVRDMSFMRPMYLVSDGEGREVLMAFYLDGGDNSRAAEGELWPIVLAYSVADWSAVRGWRAGTVVAVNRAMQHRFLDGQVGLRLEDQDLANVHVSHRLIPLGGRH